MDSATWTCPHCNRHHSAVTTSVVRCLDCRFVFPAVLEPSTGRRPVIGDPNAQTVSEATVPIKTDRYEFVRVLASGAQGRILLARHRHLDQECVIKIVTLHDEDWADVAIARLQAEARAGVRVNHVNVARVLDCDHVDGTWYFAMEYVEGLNLREVLHEVDAVDWTQAVDVGLQTVRGLAAIHEAELVHRDIKPSNLMLTPDGQIKIMDLGLVKIQDAPGSMGMTRAGQLLGTPYYMPPEQFEAEGAVDARSDVYALGATLYHLAAGRPPFESNGVLALAEKHRRAPVEWDERCTRAVPSWLRAIIERCLGKRSVERFASAAELLEALATRAEPVIGSHVRRPAGGGESARPIRPRGIVVSAFRNLTDAKADDWVGEAIAEYLTSRLMELEGVFVADRQSLDKVLEQQAEGGNGRAIEPQQLLEAARLVGASTVVAGTFQRSRDDLRVTGRCLFATAERPAPIGTFTGTVTDLFELEDRIAEKVLALVGRSGPAEAVRGDKPNAQAHEMYMRGRRAFADGDYHRAIELADRALLLDPEYVEPLGFVGACWARLGEYDRAVEYHQRQEEMARENDDPRRLAEALANLGVMYYYKGEYPLAYEFLDSARQLGREANLANDAAKYHGNLGFVLMRLQRFDEAESAFEAAVEHARGCGDLVSLIWPYNGLGGVLLKQGRYAEAREYYQRALALAEEVGDRVNVGVSQMNLGRCACLLTEYTEAARRFDAAWETLEQTDFWNGLALVYEHRAEMHLALDEHDEALACIDRRIELAAAHGNNRMEAEGWEQKARAFERRGQTDQALDCLRRSLDASQRPAPSDSLHRYLQEVAHRTAFR